jgi:lysyl-tRNA synthetase class II
VTNNNHIEISNVYEIAQDFINENVDHLQIPEFTIKSPNHPKNMDRSGIKIRTYDNLYKKAVRLIQTTRSLSCDAGLSDEENDNENPTITEISAHLKKIDYFKQILDELQDEVS